MSKKAYLVLKPAFIDAVLQPTGSVVYLDPEVVGEDHSGFTLYSQQAVVEASKPSTADAGQGPKASKNPATKPVAGTSADAAKVTEAAKNAEVKIGGTARTSSAQETLDNEAVQALAEATAAAMVEVEAQRFPTDLADVNQADGMVLKNKLIEAAQNEGVDFKSDHNKNEIMVAIMASRALRVEASKAALS